MQASNAGLGFQTHQFEFSVTATNNFTVVVEASTDLATWVPLEVFENLLALSPNDDLGARALVVGCHFELTEPERVRSVCRFSLLLRRQGLNLDTFDAEGTMGPWLRVHAGRGSRPNSDENTYIMGTISVAGIIWPGKAMGLGGAFLRFPLVLLLLALPAVMQAQFTFTTNNGTITITKYTGSAGAVVIPDTTNGLPVTTLGNTAFQSCFNLTNVSPGTNLTTIGDGAFGDCTSLTAITVNANNPAFSSLAGVLFDKSQTTLLQYPGGMSGGYVIPNTVTNLETDAFYYCSRLTSVTLGTNVTSIGTNAFYFCSGLTGAVIGTNVTRARGLCVLLLLQAERRDAPQRYYQHRRLHLLLLLQPGQPLPAPRPHQHRHGRVHFLHTAVQCDVRHQPCQHRN